jgi:hypothetical protein
MKIQNIVQQFHSMADTLQNNPAIDVVICEFNSPATEEELDEARSQFNLTPAMVDFYSQANGIKIQWERREQKEITEGGLAAGYINLLPVQEVFGDWKDIIYFEEDDSFKPLHPLDFFIDEACAALYLDGSNNPQVYYHYLGEEMSPLGVDFEGYLQLLLKSRGFWYWHKAIAQPEYFNPYVPISVEERNFREIMPQLFTDFDASDFQRFNDED